MKEIVILALVIAGGWYGYGEYQRRVQAPLGLTGMVGGGAVPQRSFACDGRVYCSQMTSCAEATFFLQHCPATKMDGNNDGVPCEKQWCK